MSSVWGNDGLAPSEEPEFARLAEAFLVAQDAVTGSRPPDDVTKLVRRELEEITRLLEPFTVPEPEQLAGYLTEVAGRGHSLVPLYHIDDHDEEHVRGRVTFGRFYLGGNGAAHGGAIPLLFDDVLGRLANTGDRGRSRTAFLRVDYRKITPVGVELRLEARFTREEGRKRFLTGAIYDGDTVTADAEGLFVALRPGQP